LVGAFAFGRVAAMWLLILGAVVVLVLILARGVRRDSISDTDDDDDAGALL
jgi:hypothetical protein